MGTSYANVKVGTDLADVARVLFRDAAGAPVTGLTIPYVVRNVAGASVASGTMVDLIGAPGWYRTASFVLAVAGPLTVEYVPPVDRFTPDADTVHVVPVLTEDLLPHLLFLRDFTGGNWKIENDQMIFYKDGLPATELMRFNLFDRLGSPNDEVVFERRRV